MAGPRPLNAIYPRRYEIPLLIGAAAVLLATGLCLPLFHVTQMVFWKSSYSVITGVVNLAKEGNVFLALIIFVFSVLFPIIKLLALAYLWMAALPNARRAAALYWLGFLGKWSMLDVLLLALAILAVKMQALAKVEPQVGVYVFCAAVFLSIVATTLVESLARRSLK